MSHDSWLKNRNRLANVQQISKAPILGRTQSMINRIFGDPLANQNAAALNREIARLHDVSGPAGLKLGDVGTAVQNAIKSSRKALSAWAETA